MNNKYDFDLISFGIRLKEIRKFNHITQEEAADSLNVSVKTVQNWENGIKAPSVDNLMYLADLYGMRIGEILQDEDYRIFTKRYKCRIRTIETFEIPGKIETFAEITEDNYFDNYQIWIFDSFANHKRMHASMQRLVTYDEVKEYIIANADMITSEYREWLLSVLSDSDENDRHIRRAIEEKSKCESSGMYAPGCVFIDGTIYYNGGDFGSEEQGE